MYLFYLAPGSGFPCVYVEGFCQQLLVVPFVVLVFLLSFVMMVVVCQVVVHQCLVSRVSMVVLYCHF